MSKRVITSVHFDLKFDVRFTPPTITVTFADIDDAGVEEHTRTRIHDTDAADVLAAGPAGLLAAVNAKIDAQALAVPDLASVASRVTAADEAEQRRKDATAAKVKLEADNAAADAALAAKKAELAALTDQAIALTKAAISEVTP